MRMISNFYKYISVVVIALALFGHHTLEVQAFEEVHHYLERDICEGADCFVTVEICEEIQDGYLLLPVPLYSQLDNSHISFADTKCHIFNVPLTSNYFHRILLSHQQLARAHL